MLALNKIILHKKKWLLQLTRSICDSPQSRSNRLITIIITIECSGPVPSLLPTVPNWGTNKDPCAVKRIQQINATISPIHTTNYLSHLLQIHHFCAILTIDAPGKSARIWLIWQLGADILYCVVQMAEVMRGIGAGCQRHLCEN